MVKEKSQKDRRTGKKNPLRFLTCNMNLLTVSFVGIIVEAERKILEEDTAFEKLNFYLMELNYKTRYAEALLQQARTLPRKQKKAQKEKSSALLAELPVIRGKIAAAAELVNPESEGREKVLCGLVSLFSLYEDSEDSEAKKVIGSQKELFGFTDEELKEEKLKDEKELDIGESANQKSLSEDEQSF